MQIDERPGFQNWFWGVQRTCWALLVLCVIAALAGLAGAGGPLAGGTSKGSTATVSYAAITRINRSETLIVRGGQAELILDERFLQLLDIRSITPAPARQASVDGELVLSFDGSGEMSVAIGVTARQMFVRDVGLRVGTERHDLTIFVLP